MADNLDILMHAIRIQESGDDYTATNASGHFGAYQFDIGTWVTALNDAGIQYDVFAGTLPSLAPPSVQDAAARALMSKYLGQFGGSLRDVAEAWYGGPGNVGNENLSGGPGYPTLGQYADQVMALYAQLGGAGGSSGGTSTPPPAVTAATIAAVDVALSNEAVQRATGDQHSREQAAAGDANEAISRATGDAHSREQAAAGDAAEAQQRATGDADTRQQMAAAILLEQTQRATGDADTRQQMAAAILLEQTQRTAGDDHTREQLAAAILLEQTQRAIGDADSRQQAAAGIKALDDQLTQQINQVMAYAQSLPGLIDTRAANGYDPTLAARANLLTKLLDTVVAHDPLAASLVSKLATFIIDLAGVEDPIVRIAAQLILKQVIDRLGIDTALGAIVNDLVGSILGGGQPKTLQDIMADIGNRLDSLESAQAELAPLAPEADNLHELGTLIFDAALLAYLAAAVADPVAAANDTVAVFATVADPLLLPIRGLLGMGLWVR
jgi:hypothetical protein